MTVDIRTSCTCDCPDTCSILATVSGGRVVAIRGDPDFVLTRGFLCRKARNFLARMFSPNRVLHPMKRDGSTWRRITWDEAAGLVVRKIESALAAHGPRSVFHFQDGGSIAALKMVNRRFFNLLGGGTFTSGSLCGGAGIAAQSRDFGLRTAHDPSDLLNSRLIVIWGRNPAWTNVHLLPILSEARRKGARVALVDPTATATARVADLHVSPKPGSDAFLALGMAKVAVKAGSIDLAQARACSENLDGFLRLADSVDLEQICDVTGLPVGTIMELARLYCERKPAAIVTGWGLQRRRNGANIYRVLDALGMVTGNIGRAGGGVSHGMDELRWFDRSVSLPDHAREERAIPRPQMGRGLLTAVEPPIKFAVISGANPVNQCPNSELVRTGLGAVDFKVILDMFMTDTAALADVFLPTTHFLQERDVVGSYWHNYVMPVNVAQARIGEEKTDLEVFSLLAERLGLSSRFPPEPASYLEDLIAPLRAEGITLETIAAGPVRPESAVDVPFAGGRFPGPSGRFVFVSDVTSPRKPDSNWPYHLLSPHPANRLHSQTSGDTTRRAPTVYLGKSLADAVAVGTGDMVSVETPQGRLECKVEVRSGIAARTAVIYEGSWDRLGGTVNRLTSDELSDDGLCATYNDVRCRLERLGGKP